MIKILQNEYSPDVVSPPGETLKELLEERGMTQADLAERTGRPVKTINEIIKGKAAITSATALQLERVLGVPARFWNDREQHYRESLARQAERESLAGQIGWLKQFPLKEMVSFGWINEGVDEVEMVQNVLNFFGIASPSQYAPLWQNSTSFRMSRVHESDPFAVSVWLRRGEIEAQQIPCAPYNADRFLAALRSVRRLTVEHPNVFQSEIVRLCAEAGVAVVFVPELPKVRVSGATRWLAPSKAVIQVSLRYKTDDQLWFSFFHESGHILKHGKRDVFVDDGGENDEKEKEANQFAAEFLVPSSEYRRFLPRSGHFSKDEIREFARQIGIAPGIVVGRLQHDGRLPIRNCNDLKQHFVWVEGN